MGFAQPGQFIDRRVTFKKSDSKSLLQDSQDWLVIDSSSSSRELS